MLNKLSFQYQATSRQCVFNKGHVRQLQNADSDDGGFNKVQTATILCKWRSHLPLPRIFEVIATRGDKSLTLDIYIIFSCVAVVQHDLIAMTEAGLDQCY